MIAAVATAVVAAVATAVTNCWLAAEQSESTQIF